MSTIVGDQPARSARVDAIRELRATEFGRLDAGGHIYLDHTGSGLYPESLVRAHSQSLCASVLGNPHSRNPTARASTELVEKVRARVLEFFAADPGEYDAIFTANATAALKLVGEAYRFRASSSFRLTQTTTTANGIREYAARGGAEVRYLRLGPDLRIVDLEQQLAGADRAAPNLFAYPAQSNFSGVKHPLEWIEVARDLGYDVLLDAAAFVPANRLDLRVYRPDFVAISFYKMFGFPTGVGALIARRSALAKLERPWFGGGTVRFVSAQNVARILYRNAAAFEDGTLNFLSIGAVSAGPDFLDGIGMERITGPCRGADGDAVSRAEGLAHESGAPLVRVYGPATLESRGGAIAFNSARLRCGYRLPAVGREHLATHRLFLQPPRGRNLVRVARGRAEAVLPGAGWRRLYAPAILSVSPRQARRRRSRLRWALSNEADIQSLIALLARFGSSRLSIE